MLAKSRKFKRQSQKTLFFKILILGVLIFLSVFLISSNVKIKQKRESLYSKMGALKKEIERLNQEREILHSKISQSQTQDYLEKIARESLNLQKEGEKVVAFPILKESQEEEGLEEKNLWQKFWEKFKMR